MFFISSSSGERSPYKVEQIEKDRRGKHSFQEDTSDQLKKKFSIASKKIKETKTAIIASQIMNQEILPLEENLSIEEAFTKIRHAKIDHFPIVNKEQKLVGFLSFKKIFCELQKEKKGVLKDLLTAKILCADSKISLQHLLTAFQKENIEAVPILNDKNHTIGIVNRSELLQMILKSNKISP